MVAVIAAEQNVSIEAPIVVVGAGPVGMRFVQEFHRRAPDAGIVLYGAEAWQPYNRVRLSAALAGELDWSALVSDMTLPSSTRISARLNCAVRAIDRRAKTVIDVTGRRQPYSSLVLATGSTPHVPDVPGMNLAGVFTFRDMNDAQRLLARRVRSRTTVVVGGGLLGLEAARAMRRFHTKVIVIEHLDRLMSRQLDRAAGRLLMRHVVTDGIEVGLGDGIVEVLGPGRVTGVRLRSGTTLVCDTLIVATGIRPNVDLAVEAGLSIGRGIRVNDELRTSSPDIFAVGECAEYRDQLHGLVAPGFEQAAIAAHVIAGGKARYTGTVAATRLKVLRCAVFSAGETGNAGLSNLDREIVHQDADGYRKLILRRGRLVGAMAVGEWDELSRVQEAVTNRRHIFPWQVARFRTTGRLWREGEAVDVLTWPAAATVCNCTGVTCGTLRGAIAEGCSNVTDLAARTGASTVCGSCRPLLQQLVGGAGTREPVRAARALAISAVIAAAVGLVIFIAPAIPYAQRADVRWHWDQWWRQGLYKQASGFTLIGLMLALGVISVRKRWPSLRRFGDYGIWRFAHVVLGIVVLAALMVHSGGRLGSGVNAALSFSALGAAVIGGLAAFVIAREHALRGLLARRLREVAWWSHVFLLWPLPVLLLFHVLKTYYF